VNWKQKYNHWQIIFGNFGAVVLVFVGGYLMASQPESLEYAFATGLWATLLGCTMAVSSVILELRLWLEKNFKESE